MNLTNNSDWIPSLQKALQTLAPFPHQVLALRYGAGFSSGEIGETLAVSTQTIATALDVSLIQLRENLLEQGIESTLDEETLHSALCSGATAPADLNERILARVFQPARTNRLRWHNALGGTLRTPSTSPRRNRTLKRPSLLKLGAFCSKRRFGR